MKLSFPKEIHEIADIINDAGYSLYSMGGSIRNQVLKMPVNDYDLDTDAPEEVVTKLFEVTAVLRRKLPILQPPGSNRQTRARIHQRDECPTETGGYIPICERS